MIELIGAFFISILGTFLHFTYDLSNHNKYVSLFSAVNESVWEHLKLLVFPSFLWTLIEIPFLYKNHNFLFAKCVSLIIMTLIIIFFSTIIKKVFEKNILFLDIVFFYIAIFLGQFISFKILSLSPVSSSINYICLLILIFIYGYFLIATFIPGKSKIYIDPNTKKSGFKGHRK